MLGLLSTRYCTAKGATVQADGTIGFSLTTSRARCVVQDFYRVCVQDHYNPTLLAVLVAAGHRLPRTRAWVLAATKRRDSATLRHLLLNKGDCVLPSDLVAAPGADADIE